MIEIVDHYENTTVVCAPKNTPEVEIRVYLDERYGFGHAQDGDTRRCIARKECFHRTFKRST